MRDELHAGLADQVFDSQQVFRAVLDALARPGRIVDLPECCIAVGGLAVEPLAILLSLADNTTPIWLPGGLRSDALARHLAFHAGARVTCEPAEAAFAVIDGTVDSGIIDALPIGSAEYPDRSATLILACQSLAGAGGWTVSGPGIETTTQLAVAPAHAPLEAAIRRNAALYPLGLDVIFTSPGQTAAIPRSSRLEE